MNNPLEGIDRDLVQRIHDEYFAVRNATLLELYERCINDPATAAQAHAKDMRIEILRRMQYGR